MTTPADEIRTAARVKQRGTTPESTATWALLLAIAAAAESGRIKRGDSIHDYAVYLAQAINQEQQ